ncbi:YdcF family protein [Secundilactobacillus odoratitofui]|uniref:YdcF family protein n=1 Tax=Secundilactobacillus odoratitofui TaxID=480930 RepID=UPI0034E28A36
MIKASSFIRNNGKKNGKTPTIILSGGQGGDETVPEGEAMRRYAVSHGVAESDAVAESASRNTLENMAFSKKIIDASGVNKPKTIFVTNNYHTFRAAMFAKPLTSKPLALVLERPGSSCRTPSCVNTLQSLCVSVNYT